MKKRETEQETINNILNLYGIFRHEAEVAGGLVSKTKIVYQLGLTSTYSAYLKKLELLGLYKATRCNPSGRGNTFAYSNFKPIEPINARKAMDIVEAEMQAYQRAHKRQKEKDATDISSTATKPLVAELKVKPKNLRFNSFAEFKAYEDGKRTQQEKLRAIDNSEDFFTMVENYETKITSLQRQVYELQKETEKAIQNAGTMCNTFLKANESKGEIVEKLEKEIELQQAKITALETENTDLINLLDLAKSSCKSKEDKLLEVSIKLKDALEKLKHKPKSDKHEFEYGQYPAIIENLRDKINVLEKEKEALEMRAAANVISLKPDKDEQLRKNLEIKINECIGLTKKLNLAKEKIAELEDVPDATEKNITYLEDNKVLFKVILQNFAKGLEGVKNNKQLYKAFAKMLFNSYGGEKMILDFLASEIAEKETPLAKRKSYKLAALKIMSLAGLRKALYVLGVPLFEIK